MIPEPKFSRSAQFVLSKLEELPLESAQQIVLSAMVAGLSEAERNAVVEKVFSLTNKRIRGIAEEAQEEDPEPLNEERLAELAESKLREESATLRESQKALLAAYILSYRAKTNVFSGRQLNQVLKELGFPLSNVTAAISPLVPDVVKVVSKAGAAKQAQKLYLLETAAEEWVKRLVKANYWGALRP